MNAIEEPFDAKAKMATKIPKFAYEWFKMIIFYNHWTVAFLLANSECAIHFSPNGTWHIVYNFFWLSNLIEYCQLSVIVVGCVMAALKMAFFSARICVWQTRISHPNPYRRCLTEDVTKTHEINKVFNEFCSKLISTIM